MRKPLVYGRKDREPTRPNCPECGRVLVPERPYPDSLRFNYACMNPSHGRQTPMFRLGDEQIVMPIYANERGRARHTKGTMPGAE